MQVSQKKKIDYRWQQLIKWYLFFLCIIVIRVTYLQLFCHAHFTQRSKNNYLRTVQLLSHRGDIIDCNGVILATTKATHALYWHGSGKRDLTNSQYNQLINLLSYLALTTLQQKTIINNVICAEQNQINYCIAQTIDEKQKNYITTHYSQNKNIVIKTTHSRHYPYSEIGCHFLGYTHKSSQQTGVSGIEKIHQKHLTGKDGVALSIINAQGITLAKKTITPEQQGETIATTLDIRLQQMAENAFNTKHKGAFILMDPQTGAIKALVSRPNFDPALFLQPISHKQWHSLQQNQPFLNRACNASYPPGSLFKLVIVAAGLEHNIVDYDSTFVCNGSFLFGKRHYRCNRHAGHAKIDLMHAIAHSCNIPFYKMATQLSVDEIADYAQRFGLGKKTDCNLQEQKGIVPSTQWKEETKGEPWWQGETLSVTIGQSFLLVTPLQIACMISAIFSGYLCKPRLFLHDSINKQPLNIKKDTLRYLQKAMHAVARYGTGRLVGTIDNITVFAKTGTAQTTAYKKRSRKKDEHGWFAGYVAHKNHEPLVLVIIAENAGTARVATKIAHNFLKHYKNHIEISTI